MTVSKDIFISYKNDGIGNHFAARLADHLTEHGYSSYYNPYEMGEESFTEKLKNAIFVCKDFICIVTQSYLDSLITNDKICWIREELLWARIYSRHIVPIFVNGASMPSDKTVLPEELQFFAGVDGIVFTDQYLSAPFDLLVKALKSDNNGNDAYRDLKCSNSALKPEENFRRLVNLASQGDTEAMYKVGMMYFHGVFTDRNFKEAAKWLKKVSASDSPYTIYADTVIARMYYAGVMPREEQSYEKSFQYHKKAIQDPYSAAQVAFMLKEGSGCDYDYDLVEKSYLSIIDSSDSVCLQEFADFYERQGEFKKAANVLERIAYITPDASYKLGMMYKNGVLNEEHIPDFRNALTYFKMSSELGNVNATYECGRLYFNPTGPFKKDFNKAQEFFIEAANKGHMTAQYILGYMYEYGHVERNIQEAIRYNKMAAEQGHVLAAMHLGELYQIPKYHNYQLAFKYSKFAADHGCALACFTLGVLYLQGRGCDYDESKAFTYMKKAADSGIHEAVAMIEEAELILDNQ